MPIQSFSYDEATGNLRDRMSRWPDGRRDQSRLSGIAQVQLKPSFRFEPGEPIFTVGSCFARNIETGLADLGFDIVTRRLELPAEERVSETANELLNKYTPHSILNEFRWALDRKVEFPVNGFLKAGDGLWHDPHLAPNAPPASLARVLERRDMIEAIYSELPRCRIVVMTLGLVECWWDDRTKLYLNGPPPAAAAKAEPRRFRLDVLGVPEISAALEEIHHLLRRFGHRDVRLIITVSPVPLKATFRGGDVLAANTYSKSALRAAVEGFVLAHDDVDYCPSYEIVTLTSRTAAFSEDNRHVAPELVRRIVGQVLEAYIPGSKSESAGDVDAGEARSKINKLTEAADWPKVAYLLGRLEEAGSWRAAGYEEFEFRMQLGVALSRAGQPVAAEVQFSRATVLEPASAIAAFNLGAMRQKLGRNEEAETWLRKAVELDPNQTDFLLRLIRQVVHNGRFAAAEPLLNALARHKIVSKEINALRETVQRHLLSEGHGEAAAQASAPEGPLTAAEADAMHRQARIHFRERRYGEAAEAYGAVLTVPGRPDEGRLRLDRGISLLRDRQTQEGVDELLRAVELLPQEHRAHYKLGLGLARLRREEEALERFEQARALSPATPDYSWRLGLQLIRLGRLGEGEQRLHECLALDANHGGATDALAGLADPRSGAAGVFGGAEADNA